MVGTLFGMVAMLDNLNDKMVGVGSMLAVSFLSTLYGVISARMVYMSAGARFQQDADTHYMRNNMITDGMVMPVCRRSPFSFKIA
jgi:chemotaxis protein MotA